MQVFDASQSLVEQLSKETQPIGMVPTMGALHLGHLSLIKKALSENKTVLVSIFINPTQFDNKVDLENYPINIEADLRKIEQLPGQIFVYAPKVNDIYGKLLISKSFDLGGLDQVMEGEKRSGHFQGVATIVWHFLKIFTPTHAYFGEKDFQQLRIIEYIAQSLKLRTKIISCPIIREKSGLAMSSRNTLLSNSERKLAAKIFEGLKFAKSNAKKESYGTLKKMVMDFFEKYDELNLEYFTVADPKTLKEVDLKKTIDSGRGFIAVHLGKIRLIDNLDIP